MRKAHVSSGGRYPALRTIAVLHLFAAIVVAVVGAWRAVSVFRSEGDVLTNDLFGAPTTAAGKVMVGACWLAVTFVAVITMFAIAELIKLFIDIEHNTRALAGSAADASLAARAQGALGADGRRATVNEGPAVPFAGDRKILEGDETAEGALIRGH